MYRKLQCLTALSIHDFVWLGKGRTSKDAYAALARHQGQTIRTRMAKSRKGARMVLERVDPGPAVAEDATQYVPVPAKVWYDSCVDGGPYPKCGAETINVAPVRGDTGFLTATVYCNECRDVFYISSHGPPNCPQPGGAVEADSTAKRRRHIKAWVGVSVTLSFSAVSVGDSVVHQPHHGPLFCFRLISSTTACGALAEG